MLVLSRKLNEAVIIDGSVEVKIIEISGDKVKIGINAPQECKILRSELCNTIDTNKEASATKISAEMLRFIKDRSDS